MFESKPVKPNQNMPMCGSIFSISEIYNLTLDKGGLHIYLVRDWGTQFYGAEYPVLPQFMQKTTWCKNKEVEYSLAKLLTYNVPYTYIFSENWIS